MQLSVVVLSEEMFSEDLGFQTFLKMARDVPALVGTGSGFHQRGTTDEKGLDWPYVQKGSNMPSPATNI